MREGKIENLPKWAQEKIRILEMRLTEHDAQVKVMNGDVSETNTTVIDYVYGDQALKPGSRIGFDLMSGQLNARINKDGTQLEISTPHGALWLCPQTSNTVKVEVKAKW